MQPEGHYFSADSSCRAWDRKCTNNGYYRGWCARASRLSVLWTLWLLRCLPTQSMSYAPVTQMLAFLFPWACCSWITLLIFKTKSGGPFPCFPNLKWANSSLSGFLCFLGFSLFLWYLCLSSSCDIFTFDLEYTPEGSMFIYKMRLPWPWRFTNGCFSMNVI